jgi:N-acetyl-gamma-glutamylphosphate reductase
MEVLRGKNGVILLSVLMVCIAGIIIAVVLHDKRESDPISLANQLREAYTEEYGVTPTISVYTDKLSQNQSATISKDIAKRLNVEVQENVDRLSVIDLENNIIFSTTRSK